MIQTRYRLTGRIAAATLAAVLALQTAYTTAQEVRLEELVVVARKTQENVQDIPLTISVFSEKEIERLAIQNTESVIKYNPGMTLTQGIGGQDIRPDIRGVTTLSGRSNVAILVDGVDQTSDALIGTGGGQLVSLDLYDLQRIEVVRGPQSALYGRNAFAGAINYITRRPSDEFQVEVKGEAGSDDLYRGGIAVEGPITDTLNYRVSAHHKESDGQYDHPVTGKNLGDQDTDAGSISLEWAASDTLNFLARADYADQELGERPIAISPYNACTSIDENGDEVRTEGVCDLMPFVQSPTSIGELEAGEDDIRLSQEGTQGIKNEIFTLNLQTEWDLDRFSLFSNTGYTNHDADNSYDLDHQETVTSLPVVNMTPPGAPPFVKVDFPSLAAISFPWVDENNPFEYVYDAENERDVFFQDLRASFKTGDNMDWMVGAEYYYEDYKQKDYQRANGAIDRNNLTTVAEVTTSMWLDITAEGGGGPPPMESIEEFLELTGTSPRKAERQTEALGIYAAMNWEFIPDWELNLSARYQKEDIDIEYETIDPNYAVPMFEDQKPGVFYPSVPYSGGPCPGPVSPSGAYCSISPTGEPLFDGPRKIKGTESFDDFNPRASLTWHYNDQHMFYGSAAKGTKPGGFNFESILIQENVVYDQEELYTYELGWKGTWWEDRILFNGAIYYNKNKDKQASSNQPFMDGNPPVPYVDNIGDAESYGLELSNTVLINEYVRLDWSYSYIDAEYDGFVRTRSDGASTVDLSGEDLPRTPEHSALVSLQFNYPIGTGQVYARSDVIYRDEMSADDIGWTTLPELTTLDLQLGWIEDNWEVIGYVNNVTDESELVSGVGFVDFQQQFQNMYTTTLAIERHGGIRATYRF